MQLMPEEERYFLMVDSDPGYLEVVRTVSQDFKLRAVTTTDNNEAEQILREKPGIEGVMVDHHPFFNSTYDLLDRVRRVDPNLPVICYTTDKVTSQIVESLEQSGADMVVSKVGDIDDLEKLVDHLSVLKQTKSQ